jgi:hypothetical protein
MIFDTMIQASEFTPLLSGSSSQTLNPEPWTLHTVSIFYTLDRYRSVQSVESYSRKDLLAMTQTDTAA